MNLHHEYFKAATRRHFFGQSRVGLGAVVLATMLQRDGIAAPPLSGSANSRVTNPLAWLENRFISMAKLDDRFVELHHACNAV